MTEAMAPGVKRMRLRYAGRCRLCRSELPAASDALYEQATKTVRCVACVNPRDLAGQEPRAGNDSHGAVDAGVAGASARQEFARRRARRQERIRTEHPYLGELILKMTGDPQSTRAWDTGAIGEERLGARLNEQTRSWLRLLHDRSISGSRANIDHLAVTRQGVFVIDAKRYQGRPRLRAEGGLIRPRVERLLVGSRDCTKLVDGLLKQVELVRSVVGDAVIINGVLCFVDADWPLVGGSFRIRNVDVLWPRKLFSKLNAEGPLGLDDVGSIHRLLGDAFPPAR